MGFDWQIQVRWLGIVTGSGTIGVTIGAVAGWRCRRRLAPAPIAWCRAPAGGRPVAVFSGGEPLPVGDTLGVVDFAEMAEAAFHPVYALDPDPSISGFGGKSGRAARSATFYLDQDRTGAVLTAVLCATVLLAAVALP